MSRTISSNLTFFWKFVCPVAWIGGFAVGTVGLFSGVFTGSRGEASPDAVKWQLLALAILGSAFVYWVCARLKRVMWCDRNLLISNFHKRVVVPIGDIEKITENRWINIPYPVTLHLCRDTAFGKKVVFMPKIMFLGFASSHPVVQELRKAAARESTQSRSPAS